MSDYKEYTVRVYDDGSKHWYLNGKHHREDGPAIEDANGYKAWYLNGKHHREDGPAVEYADGYKTWWINGNQLTEEEFNNRNKSCDGEVITVKGKQYRLGNNMPYKEYTVRVYDDGSKIWCLNGKFHREDGPAVEFANGRKEWYKNGKCHREDGPAIEYADGTKKWWINGKRHREDGPAVEYPDGSKLWYINGKQLTEEEFNNRNKSCDGKIVEIEGKRYKLTLLN